MKNTIITLIVAVMAVVIIGRHCAIKGLSATKEKITPIIEIETGVKKGEVVSQSLADIEPQTTQIWRITGYCKESCCCGKWADGITASGAKAQGKLIAAPFEIPFGTWIDIPGYGTAEVLDRGGAIKGCRLDLLFPTHQEAKNWGVKYLEIEI